MLRSFLRALVRAPALVPVVMVVAALAVGYAWAVSVPVGAAVDEDFHLASIWCPDPSGGSCDATRTAPGSYTVEVPQTLVEGHLCLFRQTDNSGACTYALSEKPIAWDRVNNGIYSGIYYKLLHPLAGAPTFESVAIIRLVNTTLAVALLASVAMCLPRSGKRLMLLALLPVSFPLGLHIVTSVNPSSWSFSGVPAAWFGAYAALRATNRRTRIVATVTTAVATGMAVVARADSAVFVVGGLVVVAIVSLGRLRPKHRRWFLIALVVAAVAGLAGALGAANAGLLTHGFSGGTHNSGLTSTLSEGVTLFVNNVFAIPGFMTEFASTPISYVDLVMSPIVWVPVLGVVAALFFAGFAKLDWRKGLALAGLVIVYTGLPLYIEQIGGHTIPGSFQPRYVYPILPLIMAVVLWHPRHDGAIRLRKPQATLAVVALTLAHAIALHTFIRRFVTGMDVFELNLNVNAEWWHTGPSPMLTWTAGTVGFAILAAGLFLVNRDEDHPEDHPGEGLRPIPAPLAATRHARR